MDRKEIAKINDPLKKFLAFLNYAGIESDRIYFFANKPSVAVPKTARISNPELNVENGTFVDENGEKLELLVVSPSSELKEEWKRLWKEYNKEVRR